jgi:HPr kinase/phosphorylase
MRAYSRQAASFSYAMGSEYDFMDNRGRLHGSCVSKDGNAVLVLGPPGSGKSDLALRLLSHGFDLVADDQVDVADGIASSPAEIAGLLEVRGVGVVRLPYQIRAHLALIVELDGRSDRLPIPHRHPELALPVVRIDAFTVSAPDKVALALNCAIGRVSQVAGAFAT